MNNKKQKSLIDIAKILGLGDNYINYLKNDYLKEDEMKKARIAEVLWRGYFQLKEGIFDLEYKNLLGEVALGKRKDLKNIYQEAQKKTDEIIESLLIGEFQNLQKIEELRQKIALWAKGN